MKPAQLSSFLALGVLPLIFDMRCADPITAPKLCCWLVAAGLAAMSPSRPWSLAEKLFGLWFFWAVLSSCINGVATAWIDLLTIFAGLVWARSPMPGRNIWLAWGFGLTVFYSWLQRLGLDPFSWSLPELSQLRTIAALGNPNYLAMYLACLFPLAWHFLYRRGVVGWALAFLSMLTLLLTATRGSILVLSAVSLVTAIYCCFRSRRVTHFWGLGLLLLALSWGTSLWLSGRRQFALSSSMVSLGSGKDYSVAARKLLWQSAWRSGCEHPLVGVGPGHFGDAYLLNRSMEPDVLMKRSRRPEDPHNEPLRVLSETGWVGFCLWSGWLLLALRAHWRRPGPETACLLVLLGNSLTNCLPMAVFPLLMLWTVPSRTDAAPSKAGFRALPLVLLALLAGLAGWLAEHAFWWDDEWKIRARALPRETSQLVERRIRALDMCSLYCPPWFRDTLLQRQCSAWQDLAELTSEPLAWRQAERYARLRTERDSANAYCWRNLAHVYDRQGRLELAMSAWREAERRDLLSPAIPYFMAQTQHRMGDSPAALRSLQRSLELFSNSRQVYRFRAQIMIEQGRTWEGIVDWVDSQVIDEGI